VRKERRKKHQAETDAAPEESAAARRRLMVVYRHDLSPKTSLIRPANTACGAGAIVCLFHYPV
jgi:hypothetical protein